MCLSATHHKAKWREEFVTKFALLCPVFGFWGWVTGSPRNWDQRQSSNQSALFPQCLSQGRADNGDWVCVGVMMVTEEEMRSQEDEQAGWENGPLVFNIPTGFYSLFDLFSKSLSILLVSLLYTLCFVNIPDVNTLSRGYVLTDTWSMPPIRGLLFLLGP